MADLSPREIQVLTLVASGHTNPEAARALHVLESTVKEHLQRINKKLGTRSRAHAVAVAYERGILGSGVRRSATTLHEPTPPTEPGQPQRTPR